MRTLCSTLLATALLAPASLAQFTLIGPDNAYATREGDSNFVLPWNIGASDARVQFFQDSTVFTGQGVTTPIRITRLRYRADALSSTWNAGTYPSVQIDMSTCPVDYTAVTSSFANNHGADRTTVHNGAVQIIAGSGGSIPGPWYVDIALTTPFVYDPTAGNDLAIDYMITGAGFSGGKAIVDHVSGTGSPPPLGSRVWDTSANALTTPTARWVNQNYAPVCEFSYEPTVGLWPNFTSDVTTGQSPLTVQFTDLSVSDDPIGVVVWQWDLDGDGQTDSNSQNPSFIYTACGSYSVSLTVIDATNGMRTLTVPNYIVTDTVEAEFSYTAQTGNTVMFTDTSTPTPTTWAWDFDGDGVTDSTQQNPVWVFPHHCSAYPVTLSASLACGPADAYTDTVAVSPGAITTNLTGGVGSFGSGAGAVFDVQVLNPKGVNICAVTNCPYTGDLPVGSPVGCEVYITDAAGGYAANHTNSAVWRNVATGTGTFLGGNSGAPVPIAMVLDRSIYLPAGNYGMYVYMTGIGMAYSFGALTVGTADLTIITGGSKWATFNGSISNNRSWNGTLHYDTAQTGGGAGFGFFGAGCAGSLGIARQSFTSLPQLGSTVSVSVDNLPADSMFYMLGFSRTASGFGPLPLSLLQFGAPGCLGRVSPDATVLSFGANNMAPWSFGIPANPALNGQEVFTQPLVIDPGFNALGGTVGDAYAILIGI